MNIDALQIRIYFQSAHYIIVIKHLIIATNIMFGQMFKTLNYHVYSK